MPTALGALFGTPSPGVRAGGRGCEAVTTANSRFSNSSYLGTYQAMTGSAGLEAERVLSKSVGVSVPFSNEGPGTKSNTAWPPGEFQAAVRRAAIMTFVPSTSKSEIGHGGAERRSECRKGGRAEGGKVGW